MLNSPFKFLDAYTKEDRDIFFGRDQEIEELYQRVFESKVLLVCGVSGTGKSSLIQCGLANKFEDSDWLPVNIRRGRNMLDSLVGELNKLVFTPPSSRHGRSLPQGGDKSAVSSQQSPGRKRTSGHIVKTIQSIYLDHFKPIYLIFDQFEELFIFGNPEERKEFISEIKKILDSDVQCKVIFVMREEYLASAIEFEREIPTILTNRLRVERMTWANAMEAIDGPCKVAGIEIDEGFAEAVLEKLNPESSEVELTYLQVILDKIFKIASSKFQHPGKNDKGQRAESGEHEDDPQIRFMKSHLDKIGDVSDLLGSFLEDQIKELDDPDMGLVILKSFVSIKGTKRQVTLEDVTEFASSLGKTISDEELKSLIINFVNLRILRGRDESGRYELRHDSLASKIYEKITLVEKEMLEVRQFIENAYINYQKRGIPLNSEDLAYISTYESRLFLKGELDEFVQQCKKSISEKKRSFNRILRISAAGFFLLISAVIFYYIKSTSTIKSRKLALEASLQLDFSPGLSFTTALKAYEQDTTSSLAVKALFDAFYALLKESQLTDSMGVVYDPMKDIFNFNPCESDIEFAKFSEDGEYIYGYLADNTVKVWENNGLEVFSEKMKDTTLLAVNFAPDNKHIAAVYDDSSALVWNITGEVRCSLNIGYNPLNPAKVISFSPTEPIYSNLTNTNIVQVRNFNGELIQELNGHTADVNALIFSPNGRYLASASNDSSVIIWEKDTTNSLFNLFRKFKSVHGPIWSVDFASNSKWFIMTRTDLSADFGYVCFLCNLNDEGDSYGQALHDSNDYRSYPEGFVDFITGLVVSADFTSNDNAIIFTSRGEGQYPYLRYEDSLLENGTISYRIFPARESRWRLMSKNRVLKNYPWTEKDNCQYSGIDMAPQGYLASSSAGYLKINLFHWDKLPIFIFDGAKPDFSPDGKYLLTINDKSLHLFPSDEKEIIRLILEEQLAGSLDRELKKWRHIFSLDD